MTTTKPAEATLECCMCGDSGLSYELFQCQSCRFRSQHRYCSNLYPKAESYILCNWCLTQKEEAKEKSQNSSNSSSSSKKDQPFQDHLRLNHDFKVNIKVKKSSSSPKPSDPHGLVRGSMKLQPSGSIKKQRSLDHHHNQQAISTSSSPKSSSPLSSQGINRKRIITNGEAEKIRRTRSEDISNINRINSDNNKKHGVITRQVFRNKVRRYKLLDEVSSQ